VIGEQSVGRIRASYCGEPTTTFVSAPISDDRAVTGAKLAWVGPDQSSGTIPMVNGRGGWSAQIGPFQAPGGVTWTITAVDAAGNQAQAAGETAVLDCPVG
jgi:hypothetical protein